MASLQAPFPAVVASGAAAQQYATVHQGACCFDDTWTAYESIGLATSHGHTNDRHDTIALVLCSVKAALTKLFGGLSGVNFHVNLIHRTQPCHAGHAAYIASVHTATKSSDSQITGVRFFDSSQGATA